MSALEQNNIQNEIKDNADSVNHSIELALSSSDAKEQLEDEVLLSSDRRPAEEEALMRKLDMRLLPTIVLVFILNYIDRTAISAARLQGLERELHLTDIQYETILAILYVSYVPAQIPSNMILNRISRPSWYISICIVLWGLTSALTGVTHDYAGILVIRIFVGFPEAAFYPGAIYLLSRWYTRKELAFRSSILYGGLLISNAFGSLMAAGILSGMEGKRGIQAWRWLFYIEGCITIFIGLIAIWSLPDYPHNTRWLSPAQRRLAQVRLAEDAGEADNDSASESSMEGLKLAIKDPKTSLFALMTCAQLLGLSFVNFFPTLTATLGFGTTISLLLAAPPWILATLLSCVNAWHADRTGERFFHITGWFWSAIIGYIVGVSTFSVGGRYVALFLMAGGYCGSALTLVWVTNAIPRPPSKRSAAIALVNGFGNIGTLIGSFVWKAEWGPDYRQSMFIGIACFCLSMFLAFVIRQIIIEENQRLEDKAEVAEYTAPTRERVAEAARLGGITFAEALEKKKVFRYLY